jgi:hypothetical protein
MWTALCIVLAEMCYDVYLVYPGIFQEIRDLQDDYVSRHWTFYDRVGEIISDKPSADCITALQLLKLFSGYFRFNI